MSNDPNQQQHHHHYSQQQQQQQQQQQLQYHNPDSLYFLPPPFPTRGSEPFAPQGPVETAALQLQRAGNFEQQEQQQQQHHDIYGPSPQGDTEVNYNPLLQLTHNHQQLLQHSLPPDPLAAAAAAAAAAGLEATNVDGNQQKPLATLATASLTPNGTTTTSTQANSSNRKRPAPAAGAATLTRSPGQQRLQKTLTPSQENEFLKRQLADREREIQLLKQQLIKTTATSSHNAQQAHPYPVAHRTAHLVGDAVLALASAEYPTDPNSIKNLQDRWRARFQQLVRYKLQYGHCNVSKADDAPLHAWVRKQRTNKQLRDKSNGVKGLMREQVDALESVGFEWVVGVGKRPHVKHDQWQDNYAKLLQYRNEHGGLPVSISTDKALTKWMQNQRARKKLLQEHGPSKSKGMTWDRVQKLELLGFKWSTKDPLMR